jgi:hypothetical protein
MLRSHGDGPLLWFSRWRHDWKCPIAGSADRSITLGYYPSVNLLVIYTTWL